MGARKITNDTWVDILNRVVLKPRLKPAARAAGVDPSSLFLKIRQSVENPEAHQIEWLGVKDSFANHLTTARKLAIVELDRAALEMALEGHSQPRYDAAGKPVWKIDPQVAADALTFDDAMWEITYGPDRRRDDVYARDDQGRLIQEQIVTPANGALVSKILSALIPAYKEHSTVEHHHTGSVWIEGQPSQSTAPSRGDGLLGFDAPAEQQQRPTNLLALPRPCTSSEEFDRKFRKLLLREVVLFRDAADKLLPPLADDVLIIGTPQYRAFLEANLLDGAKVMTPQEALDEGYANDWLLDLAPGYKPKVKPKPQPEPMPAEEVARKVQEKVAPSGKASARYDAENVGYGRPKPGGFRVMV